MRSTSLASLLVVAAGSLSGCGAIARVDAALDRVDAALASTGVVDLCPAGAGDLPTGAVVTIRAGFRQGRGVVVGPRAVLTVSHVVGADEVEVVTSSLAFTPAREVRRITSAPEDLVLLELEVSDGPFGFQGFAPEQVVPMDRAMDRATDQATDRATDRADPTWVLTRRGPRAWGAPLEPGDSGSPVLDAWGELVGLVVGRTTAEGTPVLAALSPRRGRFPVDLARSW